MRSYSVSSVMKISLVALVLSMLGGCTGQAKDPELAPTPPGVELLKPVPPPKPNDPRLKGTSADPNLK